jgi:hypothetical protein
MTFYLWFLQWHFMTDPLKWRDDDLMMFVHLASRWDKSVDGLKEALVTMWYKL